MIFIDDAAGSHTLIKHPPLNDRSIARLSRLPIPPKPLPESRADFMFEGIGPDELPISIGGEVKELTEAYDALGTGRLQATQIPGLLAIYDVQWLVIIAGRHRPNPDTGSLQTWRRTNHGWGWVDWQPGGKKRPIAWSYLFNFLGGPEFLKLGINSVILPDKETVACWIYSQYCLWQRDYKSHKSMRTLDRSGSRSKSEAGAVGDKRETVNSAGERFVGLSDPRMSNEKFRRRVAVAAALPDVRYERAIALAGEFGSVREMINPGCTCGGGDEKEEEKRWAKVKSVGKVIAARIGKAIR